MDQATLIGTTGATIILIAFVLSQIGKWKQDDLVYDAANFVGAILLLIYAALLASYPVLVLNSVWAAVSLKDIFTDLKKGKHAHRRARS